MSFATISRYLGIAALGALTWTFTPTCGNNPQVNQLEGVVQSTSIQKFPPTATINPNTRHIMVLEGCDGNKYTLDLGWQYDDHASQMAGMVSQSDYAKIEVEEQSGLNRTALSILTVSSAGKSACPKPDAGVSYDAGFFPDANIGLDTGTATTNVYDAGISPDAGISQDASPGTNLDAKIQYDSQVPSDSGVRLHPDASIPKPDAASSRDATQRILPDANGKITYADAMESSPGRKLHPLLEKLRTGEM